MVLASRSKRCFATGSAEILAGKIFMATSLPRRVSLARYTSPIPPAPSTVTLSNGPSLVPELRAIVARHYIPKGGATERMQRSAQHRPGLTRTQQPDCRGIAAGKLYD